MIKNLRFICQLLIYWLSIHFRRGNYIRFLANQCKLQVMIYWNMNTFQ